MIRQHLISSSPPVPPPIITTTGLPNQVAIVGSNLTLTCNIQLDPSVDSTVMVNRTWLGPSGATLSGTAPNKNGSIYQSVLTITSLKTTDVGIYTCSMTVSGQFIAQTTVSATVQGTSLVPPSMVHTLVDHFIFAQLHKIQSCAHTHTHTHTHTHAHTHVHTHNTIQHTTQYMRNERLFTYMCIYSQSLTIHYILHLSHQCQHRQ